MQTVLLVAAGGAVGAVLRFGISHALSRRAAGFPWGTLVVNVLGCLLLGALMAWVAQRADLAPRVRALVGVGLLGSLTTFSTFGFETVELARHGQTGDAALNVALNLLIGLGAVLVGRFGMEAWLD